MNNSVNHKDITKTLNVELDDALFKFIDADEMNKHQPTLSGKPRLLIFDIIKRFCKNYVALISLIVILVLAITCLIIPLTSPFSATKPFSTASSIWIQGLPPSYNPIVQESLTEESFNQIMKFQNDYNSNPINQNNPIKIILSFIPDGNNEYLVTYNKLLFVKLFSNVNSFPLLGTNLQGIDIWTRTWTAARDSITLAFLVATTDAIIGITVGCFLGFFAGKWIDTVLSRVVDIIVNIPTLIWFLMLMTMVGKSNINFLTLYFILISIGWVYMVNHSRLWMITVKDQEFILAAKAVGCTTKRQIFVHGLPTIIGKLSTNYVRRIVFVIISVSSLVFLGFLDSSNDPNLGTLLKESISLLDFNFWGLLLPAMILLIFSLSSQFISNGLHDALDPKIGGNR